MPIHIDISPINRLVVIVAHGQVTPEEITDIRAQLIAANVPGYARIIDTTASSSTVTREQVEKIAAMRGRADEGVKRGAVAFVVDPHKPGFAEAFAEITKGERPIQLFTSLHAARRWLIDGGAHGGASVPGSAIHNGIRVWS
jgi:hypothetical protein